MVEIIINWNAGTVLFFLNSENEPFANIKNSEIKEGEIFPVSVSLENSEDAVFTLD